VKFEVHKAVKLSIVVFWVVMPCSFTGSYQHIHWEVNQHGNVRTASEPLPLLYPVSFPFATVLLY
jgi:hypothetical protein